jgi:hypothetical protein
MVDAARIFGTEVGSTAPLFLAVLAVHVLAGLVAFIAATIGYLHRRYRRPGDTRTSLA